MTALELVDLLLSEGRLENARARFPTLPQETFDYLAHYDPSDNYKYLDWMVKMAAKNPPANQGTDDPHIKEIAELVNFFDKKIQGKDINTFKSVDELEKAVEERRASPTGKEQLVADTEVLYDENGILVVAPQSHESMRHWGGSTKWCIATSNSGYWDDYFTENSIIVIRLSTEYLQSIGWEGEDFEPYKIAVTVPEESSIRQWTFYNPEDRTIRLNEVNELLGEHAGEIEDAIGEYADNDQARIKDARSQKEEETVRESYDRDDYIQYIAKKYDVDKEIVEETLKENFTDEELDDIFYRVHSETAAYHGYDQVGYLRNEEEFWKFVRDSSGKETEEKLRWVLDTMYLADEVDILQDELGIAYAEVMRRLGGEEEVSDRIKAALQSFLQKREGPEPTGWNPQTQTFTDKQEFPLSGPGVFPERGSRVQTPEPKTYQELMSIMRDAGDDLESEIEAVRREYESLSVEEQVSWLLE